MLLHTEDSFEARWRQLMRRRNLQLWSCGLQCAFLVRPAPQSTTVMIMTRMITRIISGISFSRPRPSCLISSSPRPENEVGESRCDDDRPKAIAWTAVHECGESREQARRVARRKPARRFPLARHRWLIQAGSDCDHQRSAIGVPRRLWVAFSSQQLRTRLVCSGRIEEKLAGGKGLSPLGASKSRTIVPADKYWLLATGTRANEGARTIQLKQAGRQALPRFTVSRLTDVVFVDRGGKTNAAPAPSRLQTTTTWLSAW